MSVSAIHNSIAMRKHSVPVLGLEMFSLLVIDLNPYALKMTGKSVLLASINRQEFIKLVQVMAGKLYLTSPIFCIKKK